MATTDDILKQARELGQRIAEHPAAKKLEGVIERLQNDIEAQRTMTDYDRHLRTLSEKEASGRPIEVEDKRRLEQLQNAVVRNPILRDLQVAQMDYLDLMRKVDEAMQGQTAAAEAIPGAGSAGGAPGVAAGGASPFGDFST